MDIVKAIKYIDTRIEELEKQVYYFETVLKPRMEKDKEILASLKVQAVRLDALQQKRTRGEEITDDEIMLAVPQTFR